MSQNINATPRILFGLQIAPRCMNGQDPRPLFWHYFALEWQRMNPQQRQVMQETTN